MTPPKKKFPPGMVRELVGLSTVLVGIGGALFSLAALGGPFALLLGGSITLMLVGWVLAAPPGGDENGNETPGRERDGIGYIDPDDPDALIPRD